MTRVTWLATLASAIITGGCALDTITVPATAPAAETKQLLDYAAFNEELAAQYESFIASGRGDVTQREQLGPLLAALKDRAAQARAQARTGRLASFQVTSDDEVEAAGIISNTGTFTGFGLEFSPPEAHASTRVTIPAIIDHNISGNVDVNGWSFPISHSSSTFPVPTLGYFSKAQLTEVNCFAFPTVVVATAATQHSAGWHVKGIGFVPATKRTSDFKSCVTKAIDDGCEEESGSESGSDSGGDPSAPGGCGGNSNGGSGGGGYPYQGLCVVEYTYDMETGDIESWNVLYCY